MHRGRGTCVTLAVGNLTPKILAGSFYDMVLKLSISFVLVLYAVTFCYLLIGREVPEMPLTGNFPPGLGVVRGLDTCTSIINAKIRACRSKKAFVSAGSHTSRFCRICTDYRKMRASYAACAPVLQSILSLCEYEPSARNTLCFTAEIRGSLLRPKSTATAATGRVSVLFYPKH